ncbi:large conductance mechanosensitive channel protein MscL [Dactylosporangium sp. CS-047395]|uniref:large conductance mechanosensitive channel protein MscL n=1 Tax=Dactylosporangium sp. CS-047395 TaxID=3239936 RepID=UPI003D8DC652
MLKGFRDFISRGNVIELAVAVVIGAAFTKVVNAFTDGFLTPLINLSGGIGINDAQGVHIGSQVLDWPGFVNAIITFLLTAATVYFLVVLPMNKLAERRKRAEAPEPAAPSDEIRLLTEIRDLLATGTTDRDRGPAGGTGPNAPVKPTDT